MRKNSYFVNQGIPLILTVVIFAILSLLIYIEIIILNRFTSVDIVEKLRWSDILVGLTIYLKTSVDFAIFIGNLMSTHPGWKNRVAIEIGTAVGNALGTMIILAIWNVFRDVEWLLAVMIFIAALVLFRLAQDGLEHAAEGVSNKQGRLAGIIKYMHTGIAALNRFFAPLLKYIIPHVSMKDTKTKTFTGLFILSFTIPFILGLDDFAGYVPLFNIVNVFGFAIGVLAGHMILNAFLFISPKKTIAVVKNAIVSFLGSIAFIALAIWGLIEVYKLLFLHH